MQDLDAQGFEAHPDPMWVQDAATLRILRVNRAAVERYGHGLEAFGAMRAPDLRPPEDAEARAPACRGLSSQPAPGASAARRRATAVGDQARTGWAQRGQCGRPIRANSRGARS